MPWRTINGEDLYRELGNKKQSEGTMQPGFLTLIRGMFQPERFLDYVLNFITFEDLGSGTAAISKKAVGYHQYHAVNLAAASTLEACGIAADPTIRYAGFVEAEKADPFRASELGGQYKTRFGDRRAGVIWHTQGSGKSLPMVFYASKMIWHPTMRNPTIVVITDRNDLDSQLFHTFFPLISRSCDRDPSRRRIGLIRKSC